MLAPVGSLDPTLTDRPRICLAGPSPAPQEKFNKYIDFAESIMRALPATEVPVDLADAHMFVKTRDMFDGFYDQLGEEDLRDAMGAVSGLAKVMVDESVEQEHHTCMRV